MKSGRLVIKSSAAKMPNSCWGTYRRIGLLRLEPGLPEDFVPTMISNRSRGVVEVVETWECLNVGTTERCAYAVAMMQAEGLRDEMERADA